MKKNLKKNLILVGVINSAHGVRGEVIVKYFTTSSEQIFKYRIFDSFGNIIALRKVGITKKNHIICCLGNCTDRNQAEKFKGTKLFCSRDDLPAIDNEEEFYICDIKDLPVQDESGQIIGIVNEVVNYGAGDIIEIKFNDGQVLMFPFTKECFPVIEKDYIQINIKDFINLVK
ncbi:MAG: 16S rRNA processing protein RimM [Rickettsiaceae bacterium]|nr:16S rRNA processing protein RimM [Rickettsiaceae bacterium]